MQSTFPLAFILFLVVFVGADRLFHYRLPYVAAIALFLLIQGLASAMVRLRSKGRVLADTAEAPKWREWPTSGPVGRFGQKGLVLTFTISGLFALLNPFQLVEIVRQAIGNGRIRRRLRASTNSGAAERFVECALPFRGPWLVYNGGHSKEDSHSWDVLTQRFAYDFVIVDANYSRHHGRGTALTDYYCYNQDVLAAADGTVVRARDGIGDAPLVGYGMVDVLARSFLGNHIVIRHDDQTYSFYAHLRPGSIAVSAGDVVRQGQCIGRCGHSGHSSEPHLHFHMQDRSDFFTGAGLPIVFRDLRVHGTFTPSTQLSVGDVAENYR